MAEGAAVSRASVLTSGRRAIAEVKHEQRIDVQNG
jgi:hypothetical protein